MLPMGLLNLITSLGTKMNDTYSRFLDAWSRLQQMKDVEACLSIITECILAESTIGQTRCLQYIQTHGIDKAILELHASAEIEPFLLAMFKTADSNYLNEEVSHLVWRYGNFPRLVLLVCELCVINNVYNSSLVRHIYDSIPSAEPLVFSGLVLLVSLETYATVFSEMGLGQYTVACCNNLLSHCSGASFSAIDFLCFYEDITKQQLVDKLDFTEVMSPEAFPELPSSLHVTYSDILLFYTDLFKEVKSRKFRLLLLSHSVGFVAEPGYADFISSCIVTDPSLLAAAFSGPRSGSVDWSPLSVYNAMKEVLLNDNGIYSNKVQDPSYFVNLVPLDKYYINSCNLLHLFIKNRFSDIRLYLFLYSANKPIFYCNFNEILKICENRLELVKIIQKSIMNE
ncbi:hypothetical protein PAEPH01_0562 [Pancytospora epiphaga]|nr:hypothetical protein PAEPH01_0562 [Pancytospora epiphaga]